MRRRGGGSRRGAEEIYWGVDQITAAAKPDHFCQMTAAKTLLHSSYTQSGGCCG